MRISRRERQPGASASATACPPRISPRQRPGKFLRPSRQALRLPCFTPPVLAASGFACAMLRGAGRHLFYSVANISTGETTKGFCKCHGRPFLDVTAAQARRVSATVMAGPSLASLYPPVLCSQRFACATLSGAGKRASYVVADITTGETIRGFRKCHGGPFLPFRRGAGQGGFCERHDGPFVGFALFSLFSVASSLLARR